MKKSFYCIEYAERKDCHKQYIHKDFYINLDPSDPTLDMDDLRRYLFDQSGDTDAPVTLGVLQKQN